MCVCVRKERLDRSAGVCAYEINLIAMWLVHTNDSVPYICSVASGLHCKHFVLAAPENGEQISLSWHHFAAFAHEARFRLRNPAVAHKARFTGPAWVISAAFPDSAVAHEARSSALG